MDTVSTVDASSTSLSDKNDTSRIDTRAPLQGINGAGVEPQDRDVPISMEKEHSHNHSGKAASDDSEAETEILGASQENTPVKKPQLRCSATADSAQKAGSSSPGKAVNGAPIEHTRIAHEAHPTRKRKARESEGPDSRRDHVISNNRKSARKRARLSESEDDGDGDAQSSQSEAGSSDERGSSTANLRPPRLRAHQTLDSESEHNATASRSKRNPLADLDLTVPARRSVAPLSARSQSPRPSLRNRHRRASSFHTPSLGLERERRSRRRLGSQDEEGPARSPCE